LRETLDDLRWRGARREELGAFCKRIGETGTIERIALFVD
jgi:hypothetical protein